MKEWTEVTVVGNPVPAPRQSRQDRWKPSPSVERYRAWQDMIVLTCRATLSRLKITPPVEMSFRFALVGHPGLDTDNLIKGIKDSLVRGGILPDDTWRQIPRYREPIETFSLCDSCDKRSKRRGGGFHDDCGRVKKCDQAYAWFRIREIGKEGEDDEEVRKDHGRVR